jgi:YcaO-like protein with predicted kinase domain
VLHGIPGLKNTCVDAPFPATMAEYLDATRLSQSDPAPIEERATAAAKTAGVTRVADLTPLDRLTIPVFSAAMPNAEPGNLTVVGGAGTTTESARIAAELEAVERYCGERRGRVGRFGSWRQAAELDRAVHPRSLVLAPDHSWNEDTMVEWWPARELITDEPVLVPAQAVLQPYRLPPRMFDSTSNGLACGDHLSGAAASALFEVLERDAIAMETISNDSPRVELATVQDEACAILIDCFRRNGIDVQARVLSSAVGLPVFWVLLDDAPSRDPMLLNAGFGLATDPVLGLRRALAEAAQSHTTVIAGVRDDLVDSVRRRSTYERYRRALAPWLDSPSNYVRLEDLKARPEPNSPGALRSLLTDIARAGFSDVLAIDLSVPEIDFRVVRIVIPGMEFTKVEPLRIGDRLRRRRAVLL